MMCSTPFGINGIGTAYGNLRGKFRTCAQRLSASTESERGNGVRRDHRCNVLNAFRHQRNRNAEALPSCCVVVPTCSTPFGINGIGTLGIRR